MKPKSINSKENKETTDKSVLFEVLFIYWDPVPHK